MKKTILIASAAMVAVGTHSAHADSLEHLTIKPYVGIEYNYVGADMTTYSTDIDANTTNDFSGDLYADSYHAAVPLVGVRIGEHFGIEVGYFHSTEESQSLVGTDFLAGTNGTSETDIRGWHIDANGYVPLADRLEAIGSVGVGHYKAESTVTGTIVAGGFTLGSGTVSDSDSDTALRIGGGLQYAITDNINLRGMARYIDVQFEDAGTEVADGAFIGAIGVSYTF